MYRVCLLLVAATAVAQGPYDLEPRAVTLPGKPTLGPLYTSALGGGQGFRDNSYEDNAVTPTPSSAPLYRNPNNQPPVIFKFFQSIFGIVRLQRPGQSFKSSFSYISGLS